MKKSQLRQLIREEIKNLKIKDTYTVVWTDREYNKHFKTFQNDPQGPPENGLEKAKKFKHKLETKHKNSPEGLYRTIEIE